MAEAHPAPRSGVSPYLTIRHQRGQQAVEFYKRAFAAEELSRMLAQDGVRVMHAHLVINGGSVMLSDDFPEYHSQVDAPPPEGVTLHIDVADADVWWNRAVEAGAEVKMPLADQFWGARYGQLKDPFGHSWSIGGPAGAGEAAAPQ